MLLITFIENLENGHSKRDIINCETNSMGNFNEIEIPSILNCYFKTLKVIKNSNQIANSSTLFLNQLITFTMTFEVS